LIVSGIGLVVDTSKPASVRHHGSGEAALAGSSGDARVARNIALGRTIQIRETALVVFPGRKLPVMVSVMVDP